MTRDREQIMDFRRRYAEVPAVLHMLGLTKGSLRTARGALILCPAHGERSASCHVYSANDGTIAVRCHACGFSGDVLHLFAAAHGLTMPRDLRRVLELGGVQAFPAAPYVAPPPQPTVSDSAFDRLAEALLRAAPLAGPVADYLARRGVLDEAKRAGWGALPESVTEQRHLAASLGDVVGAETWEASGLASRDGCGFAFPAHLLLIPYRAAGIDGTICTLQRRRLAAGEPKYVFPRGRAVPAWPFGAEAREEMNAETALVFAEGAIDALTLRTRYRREGVDRAVMAIPSASTWREAWAALGTGRDVVIATDDDAAGHAVAARMLADLYGAGARSVARAIPDGGKDWNATEVAA